MKMEAAPITVQQLQRLFKDQQRSVDKDGLLNLLRVPWDYICSTYPGSLCLGSNALGMSSCRFLNSFFDGLEYEPIEAFCKVGSCLPSRRCGEHHCNGLH